MSGRFKSSKVTRGGVYKRRGRPGRKITQIKDSDLPPVEDVEMEALKRTEADVGITEYIGAHKGFSAVIKQRYSDFHVSEINQEGRLVELTSLSCDIESQAPKTFGKDVTLDDCNDLTPEVKDKLIQMEKSDFSNVEIEVTNMSKDERKRIHETIKNVFGARVVSNTIEKEEKKIMVIGKPKGKQRVDDWTQGKGRYVYFVLYKENMDTMEAANIISHKLRLAPGKVTYAGTKDRRGKTTQLACVPHIHPKKLVELNTAVRNITVGNFSIHKNPLRLGDLRGNRFRIVLRNVTASDDDVEEAASTLKERGFINYYGLQRFGSTSVPTHHIGRALLRSDWKEAIELILKPRAQVAVHSKFKKPNHSLEDSLAKARKIWWETRDSHAALQALGNKPRGIEGQLLLGLKRHKPNDLVNALEGISLNTRLIYLHSYQSYVWNHVVSRRLKEYGYKPIVGDLVFDENDGLDEVSETIDELTENEEIVAESLENENKEEGTSSVSQDRKYLVTNNFN
ncbi:hypothetical protein J437_LFUL006022 [Ladona fulva]|uniref:Pseudouridylate synthase 7 homolog n=1 Tax=Ladona fulva TaxID=123851 RepID=A0A8K0JZA3_LADFU|nr:hypothetical protein J437_LFUL006022 [Ladona fulva]